MDEDEQEREQERPDEGPEDDERESLMQRTYDAVVGHGVEV
jgi:hypothetical protein